MADPVQARTGHGSEEDEADARGNREARVPSATREPSIGNDSRGRSGEDPPVGRGANAVFGRRREQIERATLGWLLAFTAVGAVLRLLYIADEGFWFDEFIIREQARMSVSQMLDDMILNDVHPPLYQLLMIGWYQLVGEADELWLRLPSALVGCAAIPALFALARRLFDRHVALLAAGLLAVNEFAVYYAQEARAYSLLLLLSILSVWAWFRCFERASPRRLAVYATLGTALAYTHAFGILLLVWLTIAWAVARWRRWHGDFEGMRWLGVHLVMAAAYLPWVPSFLAQTARVQAGFWIPRPTWGFWAEYMAKYMGHPVVAWLAMAVLAAGAVQLWRRRGASAVREQTEPERARSASGAAPETPASAPFDARRLPVLARLAFLVGWFVFLLGVPFAISLLSEPIMHAKSAISVVAPISIALAFALAMCGSLRARQLGLAALFVASVGAIVFTNYRAQNREAWREMTQHVGERVEPDDIVVLYHPDYDYFYCYAYYTAQFFPPHVTPVEMLCDDRRSCAPGLATVAEMADRRDSDRLWVLKQRASSAEVPGLATDWMLDRRLEFNNGVLDVMVPRVDAR